MHISRLAPLALVVVAACHTTEPEELPENWKHPWIQGVWEWCSEDGTVRVVQTFGTDGKWSVTVQGHDDRSPNDWKPSSGDWKLYRYDEQSCMIVFSNVPGLEHGWVGQFHFIPPNTLQPLSLTDSRTFTRLEDAE